MGLQVIYQRCNISNVLYTLMGAFRHFEHFHAGLVPTGPQVEDNRPGTGSQ